MIPALMHGKLPAELEGMEDLLTSSVFSAVSYMPYEQGLHRVLSMTEGTSSKEWLPSPDKNVSVSYEYWPWWTATGGVGSEPDVVISFVRHAKVVVRLLIEAKLWSGKSNPSSSDVKDQLAREWLCLVTKCEADGSLPAMIYLTAWKSGAILEIDESREVLQRQRPEVTAKYPLACGWLSWSHFREAFRRSDGPIERDLCSLIARLVEGDFTGFTSIRPLRGAQWHYNERFQFASCVSNAVGSLSANGPRTWRYLQ